MDAALSTTLGSTMPGKPRFRRWPGVVIILLGAVLGGFLWFSDIDGGHRNLGLLALGGLLWLLTAAWLVVFTGGGVRLVAGLLLIGPVAVGLALFEVEHVSGDFVLRFQRRGAPKKHRELGALGRQQAPEQARDNSMPMTPGPVATPDYPRFLGPTGRGTADNVGLDRDWTAHPPEERWRIDIGAGWSSFAIAGYRAVTQQVRGAEESVTCLEIETGGLEWNCPVPSVRPPFENKVGGDGPRATPTIHGDRVYAYSGQGVLCCVDLATGKLLWSRDVLVDHQAQNAKWGIAASPLILGNRVIVTCGQAARSLAAYDRETGEPVADWDGRGTSNGDAYSSPSLATLAGVEQVLLLSDDRAAGYDATTGRMLWHFNWPGGSPNVSQPLAVGNDRVFVSAGYSKGCALLRISGTEQLQTASPLWKNKNLKTKFTNVVQDGDHLYGLNEGVLVCVHLEDGKTVWRGERYGHGQILLAGDLLIVQQEEPGDVVLVEVSPAGHRECGRIHALAEKTWNNPALSGNQLLVRNHLEAVCYELPVLAAASQRSTIPEATEPAPVEGNDVTTEDNNASASEGDSPTEDASSTEDATPTDE